MRCSSRLGTLRRLLLPTHCFTCANIKIQDHEVRTETPWVSRLLFHPPFLRRQCLWRRVCARSRERGCRCCVQLLMTCHACSSLPFGGGGDPREPWKDPGPIISLDKGENQSQRVTCPSPGELEARSRPHTFWHGVQLPTRSLRFLCLIDCSPRSEIRALRRSLELVASPALA